MWLCGPSPRGSVTISENKKITFNRLHHYIQSGYIFQIGDRDNFMLFTPNHINK